MHEVWLNFVLTKTSPLVPYLGGDSEREPIIEKLTDKNSGDGCDVVIYRMEGAGHTWPDSLPYLPEKLIGRVCRDISGTEVIWEFFWSHPKP